MSDMHRIIEQASASPFAGAHRWLRHLDPLYQADIGIEREWDIEVEANSHGCDCCYCVETKFVKVTAVSARDALALAESEIERGDVIVGIRPVGSNGAYADPDDVLRTPQTKETGDAG